jgi:hypothetical protein
LLIGRISKHETVALAPHGLRAERVAVHAVQGAERVDAEHLAIVAAVGAEGADDVISMHGGVIARCAPSDNL